jgi:hypothetical protein
VAVSCGRAGRSADGCMRGQVRSKAGDQPVPGLDHMLETLDGDGDGQVTRAGAVEMPCAARRGVSRGRRAAPSGR